MKVEALYDAFVIGEARPAQIKVIREKFPVEEMSNYYNTINLKDKTIDTQKPRISQNRKVLSHPAYNHTSPITGGLQNYLVQFVGPVKQDWLRHI